MKKSESNIKEDFSKIKSKKEMDDTRKQIIHQKEKDINLVKKNSKKNSKNKSTKQQFAASFSEDMIKNLNLGEEDQNDSFNHDFKSNTQSVSNETATRKIKTPKNNQQ